MLAALNVGPVGVAHPHERGDPIVDQDDLERWAVVVIPADHPGTHADRVLRQAHALGDVLLEHQPEAAPLLEPVDLGPQVSTQGGFLDLVKEDVEFASDHAVSLSVGRTWSLGTAARRFADPDRPLANRSACGSDRLFSARQAMSIGFSIETGGTGPLETAATYGCLQDSRRARQLGWHQHTIETRFRTGRSRCRKVIIDAGLMPMGGLQLI
ncbi:MAG: hypothetical protein M0Z49_00995 [Chloroflexi bacterium]|nr:hypothetical protein [Chloroflexota bacterium]